MKISIKWFENLTGKKYRKKILAIVGDRLLVDMKGEFLWTE